MIRMLRYLVLVVLAVMLVTVAIANRNAVTLQLLPEGLATFAGVQWQLTLPLYAVFFGGILAGLLVGFVWEWLREHKHRATAATKAREVARLERELAVMRDTKPEGSDEILALLDRKAG